MGLKTGTIGKFLFLSTLAIVLTSCATQPRPGVYGMPGFFMGLVHGFLILFSLIGGIFWDIRIYAFPNSGWLYDLGFFIGAGTWGAAVGSSGSRRR